MRDSRLDFPDFFVAWCKFMRHGELAEAEVITAIARQSISSELMVIYGKQSGCDTKRG